MRNFKIKLYTSLQLQLGCNRKLVTYYFWGNHSSLDRLSLTETASGQEGEDNRVRVEMSLCRLKVLMLNTHWVAVVYAFFFLTLILKSKRGWGEVYLHFSPNPWRFPFLVKWQSDCRNFLSQRVLVLSYLHPPVLGVFSAFVVRKYQTGRSGRPRAAAGPAVSKVGTLQGFNP